MVEVHKARINQILHDWVPERSTMLISFGRFDTGIYFNQLALFFVIPYSVSMDGMLALLASETDRIAISSLHKRLFCRLFHRMMKVLNRGILPSVGNLVV